MPLGSGFLQASEGALQRHIESSLSWPYSTPQISCEADGKLDVRVLRRLVAPGEQHNYLAPDLGEVDTASRSTLAWTRALARVSSRPSSHLAKTSVLRTSNMFDVVARATSRQGRKRPRYASLAGVAVLVGASRRSRRRERGHGAARWRPRGCQPRRRDQARFLSAATAGPTPRQLRFRLPRSPGPEPPAALAIRRPRTQGNRGGPRCQRRWPRHRGARDIRPGLATFGCRGAIGRHPLGATSSQPQRGAQARDNALVTLFDVLRGECAEGGELLRELEGTSFAVSSSSRTRSLGG